MIFLNPQHSPSTQIDEVLDLTRYALLTRVPLSQTYLKYDFSFDGSRELILAGFIPNDIPLTSPRYATTWKPRGRRSQNPEHQPHFGRTASKYSGSRIFSYFGKKKQSAALQLNLRVEGRI
jgi:hypothetical protein